jgi:hypothetical protein
MPEDNIPKEPMRDFGQHNIPDGIYPDELDLIAAYIFGYQQIKNAYGKPMAYFRDSQVKAAFTPYDRFIHAIRTLCGTELSFKIVRYEKNSNEVFRKNGAVIPDDEMEESRKKYVKIIKWDREYLASCVSKYGSSLEKLGFQRVEIPPMVLNDFSGKVTVSELGTAKHEKVKEMIGKKDGEHSFGKPVVQTKPEPSGSPEETDTESESENEEVVNKKRGRKPKA